MRIQLSQKQKEGLAIAVAWILIFASTPLYMYYGMMVGQREFDWVELWSMWSYLLAFLLIFLLHHYVLIPQLIQKKRIWQYILCVVVMMSLFAVFQQKRAPEAHRFRPQGPRTEQVEPRHAERPTMERRPQRRPVLLAPPDLARLVIALLMLGFDVGMVAWFNEQKMRQRLLLLEQQTLKQELEHLRYQINPHFFMNTLNNIHVLIDVDQERAKRAIVELSCLMRYALYEGNDTLTPLSHEVEFLQLYISLMKLRYNNKVEVRCDIPPMEIGDAQIMPLLLPTFVENAFKHGVSYLERSYIDVSLRVDHQNRQLRFRCANSRHGSSSATVDSHHGIGLENVRKRLELLYSDRYQLSIDDQNPKEYAVELVLSL